MTQITTHVLDTALGAPAAGVSVRLFDGEGSELGVAVTDADGRIAAFPEVGPGRCSLVFEVSTPFFPEVSVTFEVSPGRAHLHVPLLLGPYGYTVYRGS